MEEVEMRSISVIGTDDDNGANYTIFALGADNKPYAWSMGKWVPVVDNPGSQ